jgi:hypothetical protein
MGIFIVRKTRSETFLIGVDLRPTILEGKPDDAVSIGGLIRCNIIYRCYSYSLTLKNPSYPISGTKLVFRKYKYFYNLLGD